MTARNIFVVNIHQIPMCTVRALRNVNEEYSLRLYHDSELGGWWILRFEVEVYQMYVAVFGCVWCHPRGLQLQVLISHSLVLMIPSHMT